MSVAQHLQEVRYGMTGSGHHRVDGYLTEVASILRLNFSAALTLDVSSCLLFVHVTIKIAPRHSIFI